MSWDLATAKTILAIPAIDTTKDAFLQGALDTVLATVEHLLGRGLVLRRETVDFYFTNTRRLRVPRYPIQRVFTINGAPASGSNCVVQNRVGWIEICATANLGPNGKVEVDYQGGFNPLPLDLERALWEALRLFWTHTDATTGGPSAGGSLGVIHGSGDISRLSLPGGGAVTFDVGDSAAGSADSGSSDAADLALWGWLSPWAYILNSYRSEAAVGTAFA
jgi:hypothetical protein